MIDLDQYDGLFQKIEDLLQGLTVPDHHELVDRDENDIIMERRRDIQSSSTTLADERDDADIDSDFDFLKETEDKISAELLELHDLMRSGSDQPRREMPERLGCRVAERVWSAGPKSQDTTALDMAILKQLEEFRVSGGHSKQDRKTKQMDDGTLDQIDSLRQITESQDEGHIFQSNSQIDSLDASQHDKCSTPYVKSQRPMTQQVHAEVAIFQGDLEVEIDEFERVTLERGLNETYPLEFPGRSRARPKCARSLLLLDPSISSSSSDESSLLWLE